MTIENSKEEVFFIAETTRSEAQRLNIELQNLKSELQQVINEVDRQQKLERKLRQKLMEVSRDYHKYTEKEMMESYAQAKDAQVTLQLLQARELQLRNRRDEIERSLRQMEATIVRAENLITQISMAINLLKGSLTEVNQSIDYRQEIGLKVIKAQEEERRRVAREIHDGPAQTLANIVLRLEIAQKLLEIDPERVKAELTDLKKLVRNNLQDIRRIIFDLRPMALNDSGIVHALKKYIDNFSQTYNIEVDLKITGQEKRLPPTIEVALFRLIQEGMTNAAKHSGTSKITIKLKFEDDWINIEIRDYGHGFDVNSVLSNPGEHFGLIGMKERIEMFSGRFNITSRIKQGTVLQISIPSHLKEAKA